MAKQLAHMIFAAGAFLLSGCHTFTVPMKHVVMFESDGTAVDPTGNAGNRKHSGLLSYRTYEDHEFDAHLDRMFAEIKQTPPVDNTRKILFFIHGGLNTQVGSLERLITPFEGSRTRVDLIKEADYYPIFINWKSSLWSSYFEHLWQIRQGERWPWYTGIPSALVIFPIDVTRSLVRAPLVWAQLIHSDLQTVNNAGYFFTTGLSDSVSTELLCRYNLSGKLDECTKNVRFQKPPYCVPFSIEARPKAFRPEERTPAENTFPIAVGEDLRRCTELDTRFVSYALTLPAKLAIAPILDTFGTSAWLNMQRRIHLLFHSEEEMRQSPITEEAKWRQELADIPASGGLSKFMKRFLREMAQDIADNAKQGLKWEVVLVGHSMGTIVMNELIQLYGEKLPITDILYLVAAATIEDYEDTLFPYLQTHPHTQFYNFMLHPIEERGEIQYDMGDLPPRGSLLAWLDTFLANPETLRHRTVGRYENFLRAVHDTPGNADGCVATKNCLRSRIHIRGFSAGVRETYRNPQSHSDVAERFRFWDSTCWRVDAPLERCVRSK